jgi:hypothetical protein
MVSEMNKDNQYLLDTNSFKAFLALDFSKDDLSGWKFFCTSVQKIEIGNWKNETKRNVLMNVFRLITPEQVISPAAYYGLATYGSAKYASPENAGFLESLRKEIDTLDRAAEIQGKKLIKERDQIGDNLNRGADAMVVQAAMLIGEHCFVITKDGTLKQVCNNHSIQNANPTTLVEKIKNNR